MSMIIEECATPRPPKPGPDTPENVLDQFQTKGLVVCITGGSDGIGFAVAKGMVEVGVDLALRYKMNPAVVTMEVTFASKFNIRVTAYQVEVSDHTRVQKAREAVAADFGRLDVFIANAEMAISKTILEQTVEEYKKQMSVNVDGVFYCAKYAGEVFKRQGSGKSIITSSISAHIVNVPVDQPVYNATEAAVTHLGRSLAREWRKFARVNIVSPGFFNTKMGASPRCENEARRMAVLRGQGQVKEIKRLYLYLASDASTYTIGSDIS